jgi:hypothetical protein
MLALLPARYLQQSPMGVYRNRGSNLIQKIAVKAPMKIW